MANGEIGGPPAVDFYGMLSGLGDTIRANAKLRQQEQINDARKEAFSSFTTLDPNSPDYGKQAIGVAQRLGAAGDQDGALKFLTVAQTAADRAHSAAREGVTDSHWNQDYALRKAAAARADDPTPANFVKDPSVPGGYRPIGPADPAYIENVSAAKARSAALVPPDGFTRRPDGTLAPLPGGPQDPAYLESVAAAKARAAGATPPDGFVRQPDGSLAPIPGGPQDPTYLANRTKAEAAAKGDTPQIIGPGSSVIVPNKAAEGPVFTNKISGGGLSQDALDIRAAQWNNGDYEGATKNVGRGAQGGATLEAIANRAAQRLIEQGHTPEQAAALTSQNMQKFRASGIGQNAESRTGATREANLNLVLKATEAAIPAALEQSEKVSRTGWVPLNKIIQGGQVMTSDPELRKFGMANLQLAEHWARAMNPTGVMRESDRDLALHFLSTADSKDTYKQVVGQLKTQIVRERDAVRSGSGTTPASPAQPNVSKSGVPWSIE